MINFLTRLALFGAAVSFALYWAIAYARLLARATELHCVAHGGPNGGHVRFEVSAGAGKLERVSGRVLPVEQDVEAGKKLDFTVGYKGQLPSGEANDTLSWPRNHYSSTCKKIREDSAFQQIYGIDGTGSVTIEKFDHVVERNTNDVVTVDYVIVHEGDHQ